MDNNPTVIQGGIGAGVEGGGYPVRNFGPFRASEQLVAITRRAGEARDLPNLRQGAKQRYKAFRAVCAGVGATEGENWLPISRKRHQVGHLDFRSFQLFTEGLLVRIWPGEPFFYSHIRYLR